MLRRLVAGSCVAAGGLYYALDNRQHNHPTSSEGLSRTEGWLKAPLTAQAGWAPLTAHAKSLAQEQMPVTQSLDKRFTAELPIGMYLGRDYNVNPKVFVQWGQEVTETLLSRNYFSARELTLAHPEQTVFMRNIRLQYTEEYYTLDWRSAPLTVEAFNSHTGNTSFDHTINFYSGEELIASLVRKMVYIEGRTGKPAKLPAAYLAANPDKNPSSFSLAQSEPDSKSKRSKDQAHISVRPSDTDFNNHVGHPVYIDYIFDAAHEMKGKYKHLKDIDLMKSKIRSVDVEYKYSVVLGRSVDISTWDEKVEGEGGVANFIMYQGDRVVCLGKVEVEDKVSPARHGFGAKL